MRRPYPHPGSVHLRTAPEDAPEAVKTPVSRWCRALRRRSPPRLLPSFFSAALGLLLLAGAWRWLRAGSGEPLATSAAVGGHLARSTVPRLRGTSDTKDSFRFYLVTDLDKESHVAGEQRYQAWLQEGTLLRKGDGTFEVHFAQVEPLATSLNEKGRGFELSELVQYDGKLFTADDRSGIIFELLRVSDKWEAIPRAIAMEGSGVSTKGLKIEWGTVKDGVLWWGSIGKEFILPGQSLEDASEHLMWVSTMDQHLSVHHLNWKHFFRSLREATGTMHPGYLVHEAVCWSEVHRKWFFLPRRLSFEPYDELLDESRGTDLMIVADEFFEHIESRHVGPAVVPTHGFSSFKFVPDTLDGVIAAVKSEESSEQGTQSSYLTVFAVDDGRVLMEEVRIPGNFKYEGIEFM